MIKERRYDTTLYDIDCIKASIYKFNKKISCKVDLSDNQFVCLFEPLQSDFDFNQFFIQFDQELIDQELRNIISKKTNDYRNLILSVAFSKTGLHSDE